MLKHTKLYTLVYYFVIYSFLGWALETIFIYFDQGYMSKRGFVFGPFCIIYGFSMLTLIILLDCIKHRVVIYFLCSICLISILEFITGFAMERTYNNRWWDYSNVPFNLNGYICLSISVIWGFLALLVIKYIHPRIEKIVNIIPNDYSLKVSYIIFIFFIIDIVISILYAKNNLHLPFYNL